MRKKDFIKSMVVITGLLLQINVWGQVSKTVNVATAGTLPTLIDANQKYEIIDLTVTGNLDSRDIRYIREMAGSDYQGKATNGQLTNLNLAGVNIVSYNETRLSGGCVSGLEKTCYYSPYCSPGNCCNYYNTIKILFQLICFTVAN
jgi:hypothetical protein